MKMIENIFAEYYPYFSLTGGVILIAFAVLRESKNSELKQNGICTEGIIYEQGYENNRRVLPEEYSYSSVKDEITVRFLTEKQEWITGIIKQDFRMFYKGQYKDGESVVIYYDRENPGNFYVDSKQSETIVRLVFGIAGIVFAFTGLYQLII